MLSPAAAAGPAWPGHDPTGTYIGIHGDDSLTGPVEVNRTYGQWGDDAKEHTQILADHAAGRLPWVSFKPPSCGLGCITNGSWDAEIRAKARRYAAYDKPVITTFFHEPVGDVGAADFNAAFLKIRRVMRNELGGSLTGQGFVFAPVLNGYLWNDWYKGQKGSVESWVTPQLVSASPLLGIDHYGAPHETRRALDYLAAHGARSVGIAEFGRDQGADAFAQKLDQFRSYAGFLAVVAYFNSRIQEFGSDTSPLGPGLDELEAFKAYAATSVNAP
jgi:hypothetical protein